MSSVPNTGTGAAGITIQLSPSIHQALVATGAVPAEFMGACAPAQPSAPLPPPPPPPTGPLTFIEPSWWSILKMGMLGDTERGACISGPRGSGKTSAVHELAKREGVTLKTFQAAAGCDIGDLMGVTSLKDASTSFSPGPLVDALEADCWLFIEEANAMHPGVFSKLNTLLDGSGDKLRLPDGRELAPGAKFRVVLAFNEGYAGTREINGALRDRLVNIYADYLPPDQEVQILVNRTGCLKAVADEIVAIAGSIRAAKAELGFDLSPRALMRLVNIWRHAPAITWERAWEHCVMDLMGDPHVTKPNRDSLRQIIDAGGGFVMDHPLIDTNAAPAAVEI